MFLLGTSAVVFVVCHAGPADHFATFAEILTKNKIKTEIYATGPALKKMQERGIEETIAFSIDSLENEETAADEIAKNCSSASVVITDVGHPFEIKVQKALASLQKRVTRIAYYDNPEPYVPGGYSKTAAKVMKNAQTILFANSNLAHAPILEDAEKEVDFGAREKIGIGYYPIQQAEKIAKRRALEKASFQENKQKVFVYFGGNNEIYFSKALPAFLTILEKTPLSNSVILFQQHPGAKDKNRDRKIVEEWMKENPSTKIIFSDLSSDDAQIVSDLILYYQTSMGPQFVLAEIPTIQIGHEPFEDILVKNKLIDSVTTKDEFVQSLNKKEKKLSKDFIFQSLGIKADWPQILQNAIQGD